MALALADVTIIGAGPAGLCLAHTLAQQGFAVVLVEKQSRGTLKNAAVDGRDIALTHFSRAMLESLGVWQHIPEGAVSTIHEAKVYDGASPRAMALSSSRNDTLAYIVSNHHIRTASYAAVEADPRITLMDEVSLASLVLDDRVGRVTLSDGRTIESKLVVAADSRFSETRRKAGIGATMRDFGKTMFVCQMQHEGEHHGVAHECFNHGHTLAMLPLNGKRSSVIVTLTPERAVAMMAMPEDEFNRWVEQQFYHRLGRMWLEGKRYVYPLVGVYAEHFVARRFALVGDAAVGMHPVTAHGFNFGLKSIHFLSEAMVLALREERDISSPDVLARYERQHRRATRPLYLATSGIVSLYTNDSAPAKLARRVLLRTADRMVPIKAMLMAKLVEQDTSASYYHGLLGGLRSTLKTA